MWITPDKTGVLSNTRIYSDLLRITPIFLGLLRIIRVIPFYLGYSYSVLLRFIRITRITPHSSDYPGLSIHSAHYWSCFPLGITSDYCKLRRITRDYSDLLGITAEYSNYPELPVRIAKWSSGLPELFDPRDYAGLLRFIPDFWDYQFRPLSGL